MLIYLCENMVQATNMSLHMTFHNISVKVKILKKFFSSFPWLHLKIIQGAFKKISEPRTYHQNLLEIRPNNQQFLKLPRQFWCVTKTENHYFGNCFSNFNVPRILLNADSDSLGLEWGLRFCTSNKFPGGSDTASPKPTL